MKHKTPAALAAWNLYPLTRDPAVIGFLVKHDGDDILAQARELIAQSWQGAPDPALASALQDRLMDYLWDNDDENGEQGALELLAALEALCRDLLGGGSRALKAAENALDYRLNYLAETGADAAAIAALQRQLAEQRAALGKAPAAPLGSDQEALLTALGASAN